MSTAQERMKVARWASVALVTGALGVAGTVVIGLGATAVWPLLLVLDLVAVASGAIAITRCERASDRRIGAVGLALGVVGGVAVPILAATVTAGITA
ncbi:MAG: hypothetical protein ACK5IM_07015 [Demequina sp.]|uniref:hypothetical protein n=1 Tax=Demequina sp. TaxID=2050685 RepID=UPI003A868E92